MDFSPIASMSGGLLSSFLSLRSHNNMLAMQKKENALNRSFNSREAEKQRAYLTEMFNATNAYNDPSQVVKRFKNAGLHPALAFGGFANASAPDSASSASSNGSVGGQLPDYSGIQSAGNALMQQKLIDAQSRLADAQANKINAETPWVDRLNQSIVNLNNSGFDLNVSAADLNDKKGLEVEASVKHLNQLVDNLKTQKEYTEKQIKIAVSDSRIREIEANFRGHQLLADLEKTFAGIDLDRAQIYRLSVLTTAEYQYYLSMAALNNSNASLNRFQIEINEKLKAKYGLERLSDNQFNESISRINNLYRVGKAAESNANAQNKIGDAALINSSVNGASSLIEIGSDLINGRLGSSRNPYTSNSTQHRTGPNLTPVPRGGIPYRF